MKIVSSVFVSLFAAVLASAAVSLPRSTPEAQGISSTGMLEVIDALESRVTEMHSIVVVRNGYVIAEGWWAPFARNEPHQMFSLSKSFTSTAVGLAVAEGKLSTDDPVTKFFPDELPAEPSANLRAMRVRDLLTMSSGHHDADIQAFPYNDEGGATKKFLSLPVSHKPGTYWIYNSPATFMLSAIVTKVTGQSVHEYLRPRIYEPLGIEDATWEANNQGFSIGASGMFLRTEDIAKFGQLYLQKGKWNGKQVVPESWVAAASARQASNGSSPTSDWEQGYGYQFWRCRHGFYRGDGAHGQFCILLEKHNTVVAITSGTADMGSVMNTLWDKLLPVLDAAKPLAEDAAAHAKLKERLAGLALKPQAAGSVVAKAVGAKRYVFPENRARIEEISVGSIDAAGVAQLTLKIGGATQTLAASPGKWAKGEFASGPWKGVTATSGAWTAADTYTARVVRYHTPFATTLRLKFAGEELQVEAEGNVGPANARVTKVTGRSEAAKVASE